MMSGARILVFWDEFHNMSGIGRRNATIIHDHSTVIVVFDTMGRTAWRSNAGFRCLPPWL